MECPFVEVGCDATNILTHRGYQNHLLQNAEQHLQMVDKLHKKNLGYDLGTVSPVQKLSEIAHEVGFLDRVLQHHNMGEVPALECLKTQLKLPDIWIKKLGDICAFRMSSFSEKRREKAKWFSPPFMVQGGHKMRLCVFCGGIESGANSHLSVSLLALPDDRSEGPPSLPPHLGIKVELMNETDSDQDASISKPFAIWNPKESAVPGLPRKRHEVKNRSLQHTKILLRKQTGMPPWCSQPPAMEDAKTNKVPEAVTTPKKDVADEVTLMKSEKFSPLSLVEQYAQDYNSLAFKVTLCLLYGKN